MRYALVACTSCLLLLAATGDAQASSGPHVAVVNIKAAIAEESAAVTALQRNDRIQARSELHASEDHLSAAKAAFPPVSDDVDSALKFDDRVKEASRSSKTTDELVQDLVVALSHKRQALAIAEKAGSTTPPTSADLSCKVSPGQSTIAANETAFTISGCKTPVAKIELKFDGRFVDRTPAGVEEGSSYRTVDCGHGAGIDLVCTDVNAPVGATIVEGVAGLKGNEGFAATISAANGAAQVIKGALPEAHPLKFTGTVTKEATPNSYTFSLTMRGPWKRAWFALPRGAQVLYETQPGNGVSVGAQTQSDGEVWVAFLRIGVAHDASNYLGTYKSTVTFAGPTSWPPTIKDGGDGVDALTSSTGHASVR